MGRSLFYDTIFMKNKKKKNCFQNVTQTFETLSTVLGLFSMVQ